MQAKSSIVFCLINWTTVSSAIPNQADSVQVHAVKTQQTDLWLAASDQLAISQKNKVREITLRLCGLPIEGVTTAWSLVEYK